MNKRKFRIKIDNIENSVEYIPLPKEKKQSKNSQPAKKSARLPHYAPDIVRKVQLAKLTNSKVPIMTYSRGSVIFPDCIGLQFGVYNGKEFIPVLIGELMVGRKFGEFSPTRKPVVHSGDKKVMNKAKKK